MSMTKKDYELVASAFRYGNTIPVNESQLYWVADFLATKLDNASDKKGIKAKFLEACGVEQYTKDELYDIKHHNTST